MCRTSKLIIAWHVGKRDQESADALVEDVRARLVVMPQITTDGLKLYEAANVTDHVWSLQELMDSAMSAPAIEAPEAKPLAIPKPEWSPASSRPAVAGFGSFRVARSRLFRSPTLPLRMLRCLRRRHRLRR